MTGWLRALWHRLRGHYVERKHHPYMPNPLTYRQTIWTCYTCYGRRRNEGENWTWRKVWPR